MEQKQNAEYMAKLRFRLLIELLDYQRVTFQYELKKEHKQSFNFLNAHLQKFRATLADGQPPGMAVWIDDLAAVLWESLDELMSAEDPRGILFVLKAYNAGLVSMEGLDGAPLNKMKFESLAALRSGEDE
jgi:hypothetical protein